MENSKKNLAKTALAALILAAAAPLSGHATADVASGGVLLARGCNAGYNKTCAAAASGCGSSNRQMNYGGARSSGCGSMSPSSQSPSYPNQDMNANDQRNGQGYYSPNQSFSMNSSGQKGTPTQGMPGNSNDHSDGQGYYSSNQYVSMNTSNPSNPSSGQKGSQPDGNGSSRMDDHNGMQMQRTSNYNYNAWNR